ncbi:MAG TPA: hypothetical protein VNK89_10675 [Thermoflexus sp.]|nr:hypothetical protein [Thermoflexus sp.]
MRNLDLLAAQTAQRIIADTMHCKPADVDNLATKALGVLQESGIYAATLFLYSRSSKDAEIAPYVRKSLLDLAAQEILNQPAPDDEVHAALRFVTDRICNDLDTLLLIKQVWEQTLIYVRYGAMARKAKEEE